jgi:hypothetical protein
VKPRYPIYVPSKDRYQRNRALTLRALLRDEIPFRLVIQPAQIAGYEPYVTSHDELLVLPRDDFGLLNTRNWIRAHAEAAGHARHWQLDDNISGFYRLWDGRRVPVHAGAALRVCEDLTDRFTNVGVSGLNYDMFVPADTRTPFYRNVHVYSCTLVNHEMPHRWRLRYNDDTDLCLQALTTGWATLLVNAFMAKKVTTMMVRGGNTDDLYRDDAEGDARDTRGRYEMARVLERQWPRLVTLTRKFGRYQHSVNWGAFNVPLRLRAGVDPAALPEVDEYGLTLRAVRDVRSDRIRALHDAYEALVEQCRAPDPLWRGLPAFRARKQPLKLTVRCPTDADRDRLIRELGVMVDKKFKDKAWSAWWPPRGRDDPASLRFEPGPCLS